MRGREKNVDDLTQEQILLQAHYCTELMNAFKTLAFSLSNVHTENSQAIKIGFSKPQHKTKSKDQTTNESERDITFERGNVFTVEHRAEKSRQIDFLNDQYKHLSKLKSDHKPLEFELKQTKHREDYHNAVRDRDRETAQDVMHVKFDPRIDSKAFEKAFGINPDVSASINIRQRLIIMDLAFDKISKLLDFKGEGIISELYRQNIITQDSSQKVIGHILNDCLRDSRLGLDTINDFIPNKGFSRNLEIKMDCLNVLRGLLDARNSAEASKEPTKSYDTIINRCFEINQSEMPLHKKLDAMAFQLTQALGSDRLHTQRGKRKGSAEPRSSEKADVQARKHSDPNPIATSPFEQRIKAIYDNVAKTTILSSKKNKTAKPAKQSQSKDTLFSVKNIGKEQPKESQKKSLNEEQPTFKK